MNPWVMLVAGLLIGWIGAMLLDYFVFRNRRVCTDYEKELEASVGSLRSENSSLSADVNALNARVGRFGELETTLASRESELSGLRADFDAQASKLKKANVDLNASRSEISSLKSSVSAATDLEAKLQERDTAIANLKTQFEARGAEISGLTARLADKDTEIGTLNSQLEEVDGELGKLGLGVAGAVATGGLFAGLRGRMDSLRGRLSDQDTSVSMQGDLDAQVAETGRLSAELETSRAELLSLRADLEARDAELLSVRASMPDADVDVDGIRTNLETQTAEVGRLRGELDARLADMNGLQTNLETQTSEVTRLSGELETRDGDIDRLKRELSERETKMRDMEATLAPTDDIEIMRVQLEQRDIEIGEVRSELEALQGELDDGDGKWGSLGLLSLGAAGAGGGALAKLRGMRDEIAGKNSELEASNAEIARLKAQLVSAESAKKPDDLTRIYGIGPKIAGILNANGINTFEELADADVDRVSGILDEYGGKFSLATPEIRASWHDQAMHAAADEWEEFDGIAASLKRTDGASLSKIWGVGEKVEGLLAEKGITTYQELANSDTTDILDAIKAGQGYYPGFNHEQIHQAWVEQAHMAADHKWAQLKGYKERFRRRRRKDDLKVVWGIGPKIESVLHRNGIHTYAELADSSPERLDAILEESGARFNLSTDNLHQTWTQQARLADIGDWEQLDAVKEGLSWKNVQDD